MSSICRFYGSGPYTKIPIDSNWRFCRNDIARSNNFWVNRNGIRNFSKILTRIYNVAVRVIFILINVEESHLRIVNFVVVWGTIILENHTIDTMIHHYTMIVMIKSRRGIILVSFKLVIMHQGICLERNKTLIVLIVLL